MGTLEERGLKLKLTGDDRQLTASFQPGRITDEIDLELLQAELTKQFPDLFVLEQILPEVIKKIRNGLAFDLVVAEKRDGEARVTIEANQMAAHLSISPPYGGAPVTLEKARSVIDQAGVVFGLDNEAVEWAIKTGQASNVLVASGRQPVHGVDGRVESLVPVMKERRPQLDEHGMADYRNLGEVLVVHVGEVLVRRIPATTGEPGETVLGQEIPATPGKEVAFAPNLSGVAPAESDPNILVAAISGQPVLVTNGVIVEPTYGADQVNLSTGNITFDGTVNVRGDVHAGMSIRATGDIYIAGTVEASSEEPTLEAGGDIVVKGGVIGCVDTGEIKHDISHIHCKGSFTARFIQNTRVFAEDSIFIDDTSMQSNLIAANRIIVGNETSIGKGRLVGGSARAALLVKAKVIGSEAMMNTVVEAGFDPQMQEQLRNLVAELGEWAKKMAEMEKVLAFAKQNPGKISAESLQRVEKTHLDAQTHMTVLSEEIETQNKKLLLSEDGQVIVEKKIYEGVEVIVGGVRNKIIAERGPGVFHLRENELVYDDLPR
ncbi:MAG: FapA family protein [Betaproteobacteria bacterium]|nr:FapA family protein [Betaproteobacteria bacterium]